MALPRCSIASRAALTMFALVVVAFPSATLVASGRSVIFSAPDGVPLAGMLYEASPRPAPAVVLVHMLGRSKDEWVPLAGRLQDHGITALAIDLRGHGHSGGNGSELPLMIGDVQAAISFLSSRPNVRQASIGVVGASLGANLAALAAAEEATVRAIALLSPSLDYRGLRLDQALIRKIGERSMWLAASTEDPLAVRTVKELAVGPTHEQRLSSARAHGTRLLAADQELARALIDWVKDRLVF